MTEEEQRDYEKAQQRIREARERGEVELDLGGSQNLPRVPDEIANLSALESLDLQWTQVRDLSALRTLSFLQSLNLWSTKVSDLSPLEKLSSLQTLDLNGTQVSDLSPLRDLSALQSLHLVGAPVSDLSPLGNLFSLQLLHFGGTQVSDLTPLQNLTALHTLDFNNTPVSDLSPLQNLSALKWLYLSFTQVSDLTPLQNLSALNALSLDSCARLPRLGLPEAMLARLRTLTLDGCNLADVPREFCRRGDFVDVSGEVYAYFRALREQGVGRLNECKLIVLGNGRAGKTSLMKALKDEPFDKKEPSTHAIRFWEWKPEVCFAETAVPEPVRISAWDFGGQDIYHQSHRLFLRTRAVFVVVWNVWEDAASLEIAGDEPHPLAYWLEQIVASHPEPRIVLVRTHSDEDAAQLVARGLDAVPDWCAQVPERFRALDCIALSTRDREPAAMDMLHVRLKTMLAAEMSVGSRAVPNGWTAVHAKLRAMQIENESAHMGGWRPPYPVLAAGEFAEIVEESLPADATARDPAEVRGFLHHIGALFYDARLGGRIVLDQRWAIEGLYAILQPGPARDWLRQRGGTFTARELAPLWTARGYTPEEQGVLLDFMRACGQAVEIMRAEETAAGEAVHLAPTLLPRREEIAERLQSIAEAESMTFIEAKGESLGHDAAQAIIGKIAKVFGRGGRYWRWGAQAANLNTGLFAEVDWHPVHSWTYGGAMQLRMRGRDMDLMAFAAQFRETITRAAGPTISWLAGGERGWEALRCAPQGREFGAQTDTVPGREADAGAFAIFAPDRATLQGRHLSFSLAGETAEHPGLNDAPLALYDALEAEAKTLGWKPFLYQRSSDQPDVLRELPHVGKADYVVVFLSAKYLRSEYCMEELRHVYEAEPRGTFPPRTARLFGLGDWRPAGVAGWMALREEWKAALRQHQQDCNARYAHLFPDAKKIGELVEQEPAHGWFMLCLNDGDLAHFQRAMENYVATPAPLPFNPEDPACQQWLAYWKAELLGRLDP